MIGRTLLLTGGAALALAGCTRPNAAIEVRARPGSSLAPAKAMPLRMAEAHVQLALGNFALASEMYRRALREDPDSLAALVGLASTYEQTGQHRLARRYYESALALAPNSAELLGALAASLERQGNRAEARALREEMAARNPTAAGSPSEPPELAAVPAEQPTGAADVAAAGPRLTRVSPHEVVLVTDEEAP